MSDPHRILIVEDDQILALQYRLLLEQSGYLPLEAVATGEEAVACAEALQPDLILMDVLLAGKMSGFEAYRAIRQRAEIPVVYLSGLSDDDQIRRAQELGAYGYLIKPVSGGDLHSAIEMALYKHSIEKRVRLNEKRYRMLFEKMQNGFGLSEIVYDEAGAPVDFLVLAINPAFQRMLRIHARRLVGRRLGEAAPNFDRSQLLAQLAQVAQTGQPAQFDFFLRHNQRWLEIVAFSPEAGQFAVIIEDVTERRRAEQSLQASEMRFRRLAESVREVFWLQNGPEGRMLYISPAYEQVFGRSCEEVYQDCERLYSSVHPADAALLAQARQNMARTGQPASVEYRILLPDDAPRWVWLRAFPLLDEAGQVTGSSGVVEDITQRKQAEQQISDSYRRIEQSLRRMTILRQIDTAITTHNELAMMAPAILDHMTELEEIDGVALFIPAARAGSRVEVQPAQAGLALAGLSGPGLRQVSGPAAEWQQEVVGQVFHGGQAEYLADLCASPHPGARAFCQQTGFTSCAVLPLQAREQPKGVLMFVRQQASGESADWHNFLESLALQMAIAIDNVDMFEHLKQSNRELARAYDETISGWAQALELRDKETRGHSERVYQLAEKLARAMGMDDDQLLHFRRGVLLHDIGKMGVPDRILNKTEELSPEEWIIMRQHPVYGAEMLSQIEYLRPACDVVYYHHEKWDGAGYPSGLRGEAIPLAARIFAIIDVYDALTTRRPYRPAWPRSDALTYIRQQSGKHFDPQITEIFLDLFS